jgi:hypothetical protein
MKTGQSPLEALQARKQQLQFDAHRQEDKINADIKYIQQNGVKLALHSVVSTIIPGSFSVQNNPSKFSTRALGITDLLMGGLSCVMKKNNGILSIAWNFAKPFMMTWAIKRIKKLL